MTAARNINDLLAAQDRPTIPVPSPAQQRAAEVAYDLACARIDARTSVLRDPLGRDHTAPRLALEALRAELVEAVRHGLDADTVEQMAADGLEAMGVPTPWLAVVLRKEAFEQAEEEGE